ncbi:hypothetical protein D3C80_2118550 [compost metagenome]
MIATLLLTDGRQLVGRQQVTSRLINPNSLGNGRSCIRVVTGQHHGLDAQRVKLVDRGLA